MRTLTLVLILSVCFPCYATGRVAPSKVKVLLIGVGRFQPGSIGLTPLQGPVNDLVAVQQILASRLAPFHPEFRVLRDEAAIRQTILDTTRDYFGSLPAGSTAIFYFSGHGSRIYGTQPHKPDRYDSTLLPYDARPANGEHRDIRDVELAQLLGTLDQRGVHVFVLLDSCFSGGATRGTARPRFAPAINPPAIAAGLTPSANDFPGAALRWASIQPRRTLQVVFSASEATQLAYESADRAGIVMGDFTRALVNTLQEERHVTTYHEIEFGVRTRLEHCGRDQHPHAEGDFDEPAFQPGAAHGRLVIEANYTHSGRYTIEPGTLLGVTEGSEYAIYDNASDAALASHAPIATAKITAVSLSGATLTTALSHPPQTAFLVETAHQFDQAPVRVWLDEHIDTTTRQQVMTLSAQKLGVTFTLRETAEMSIVQENGGLRVHNSFGGDFPLELTPQVPLETSIVNILQAAARYERLLNLHNEDAVLDVHFRVLLLKPPAALFATEELEGAYKVRTGDSMAVCLGSGASKKKAYLYLFSLSNTYTINLLYPARIEGNQTPFNPGVFVPTASLDARASGVDTLKVIATDAPIPAYVIEQMTQGKTRQLKPARLSPLEQLLADAGQGLRSVPQTPVTSWATLEALVAVGEDTGPRTLKEERCQ